MKRLLVLLVLSAFVLISCNNKEKAFDENLNKSYEEMGKVLDFSSGMSQDIQDTWDNAIDNHVDHHGEYCGNYWGAVTLLLEEYQALGIIDSLVKHQKKMEETAVLLGNAPASRRDCYNDYIALVAETNNLVRMVTKPSGSLFEYSMQRNEITKNISSKLDQFKIKYGNLLSVTYTFE